MPAQDSVILENLPEAIKAIALRHLGDVDGLSLKPEIATFSARGWELASRLETGESEGHWKRLKKTMDRFVALQAAVSELLEEAAELRRQGDDHARFKVERKLAETREKAGETLTDLREAVNQGAAYGETWNELLFTLRTGADLKSKEMDLLIQQSRVITVEQAFWLVAQIQGVIAANVEDPAAKQRIGEGLGRALELAMSGEGGKVVDAPAGGKGKGKRG